MTYSAGNIDLFAFDRNTDPNGMPVGKPGSDESVKDVINKMSLQVSYCWRSMP